MTVYLTDATLAALLNASENKARDRAHYLTQRSDGELKYIPIKSNLGAWYVECRASDGTLLFSEMPANV